MEYVMHVHTEPPVRTDAMSWYPYSEGLESAFSYVDRFGDVGNLSVRRGNMLGVPVNCAPVGKEDFRVVHLLGAIDCKAAPRDDDQAEAVKKSMGLFESGVNHIIEAPTGWGKTYAACAIASQLGQATLIIVPKSDLMDQWYKTLVNLVGVPSKDIGKIQADVCDYKGKRFVLGMAQSLMREGRYEDEMYWYFGLLVCDESHRLGADVFQKVCQFFPAFYRLGLSATPKRSDGRDNVLYAHIGKVLVHGAVVPMHPKVIVQPTGWAMPRRRVKDYATGVWKTVPMHHSPGRMVPVTKIMARSDRRNDIITNFVLQAYRSRRTVLVLSELIGGHLEVLFHVFSKAGIPSEDIGYYIGGLSKEQLRRASRKPVILGTYKMVSEGTDYPHWDTIVLATPRAQVKQAVGRVLRSLEGKKTPVIFDLVDADQIFKNFFRSRETTYYSLKAEIVRT